MAALLVAAALAAWAVADASRPPEDQLGARAALLAVDLYREHLSGAADILGGRCRLRPTCSSYARAVIGDHGWVRGGWLAACRLVRCGPWTPAGTHDPPPLRRPAPARTLDAGRGEEPCDSRSNSDPSSS